ncbi:hypothetical protein ACI3ET_06715 [Ornithinimicrobium sp. LYQ121]|uniref:hypothetical protein n=1 Tax=Ornithinimicrobium sp. LYQ121 TaxID=3378801 RepID=UPI003854CF53
MADNGDVEFVTLHFTGGRYETGSGHAPGYPLEIAHELQRYQQILVMIARHLVRQERGETARLPRGFADAVRLRFTEVRSGSTEVVITPELSENEASGLFSASLQLLHRSEEFLEHQLKNLEVQHGFSEGIPYDIARNIGNWGSSWSPTEELYLKRGGKLHAKYNQELRSYARKKDRVEAEEVLQGRVIGASSGGNSLEIRVDDLGRSFSAKFDDMETWDHGAQAMGYQDRAPLVNVSVTTERDRLGLLQSVPKVHSLELALPDSVNDRIREIREIEAGWLEGRGDAASDEALAMAELAIVEILQESKTAPYIYITPSGFIQLEWRRGEFEYELICDGQAYYLDSWSRSGEVEEPPAQVLLDRGKLQTALRKGAHFE